MRNISATLTFAIALTVASTAAVQSKNLMRQRVKQAKENTVRILVNGKSVGTGFAVAPGLIATNFHVVQQFSAVADEQTQVGYASNIEVQLQNGRVVTAMPHSSVLGTGLQTAVSNDVALLTIPVKDLHPFKLGHFADIGEGDAVYIVGYPFGIEQPIINIGMLSTKWNASGYLGQGGPRDVAWLDITMNKGNSGGPVLLLADDPAQDVVVGIANFNLNPFAQNAAKFARVAAAFPGNVMIMGINFKQFSTLIGAALASQSHGVGGCIAIDYVRLPE
jgi:S1-C subfamily serine protease